MTAGAPRTGPVERPRRATDGVGARAAFVPSGIGFVNSDSELARWLAEYLSELSLRCALIVVGRASHALLGRTLAIDLGACVQVRTAEVLSGSLDEVEEVRRAASEASADVVVGVGGGRTLDVAKYAAAQAELPFVSVPTQASHDGICSPVAVLSERRDEQASSLGARPPVALVAPMHTIGRAPKRTLVAGMADLSANLLAVMDWEWARDFHDEPFDDYAALLGRSAAELIVARREAFAPDRPFTPEDVEMLVRGLVLSGLAMTVAGSSRPCSGSEHLISHAFDAGGAGAGLHGEQVALGALLAARFYGGTAERVVDLIARIGAPRSPSDIGIGHADAMRAVTVAATVRPGRRSRLAAALAADEDFVMAEAEAAWYGAG